MQRLPCRVLAVQAGGRLRFSCSCRQHGVAESVQRLPPPGRGLPARGVGRGSWCGEVRPRALRPQVPKPPRCSPGAANRTCTLIARVGMWGEVAAQGSRTPFASPNGEQQGGFGVDPPPPVLARRVGCPRSRGLGWRRPRGACRVTWCGWWLADTFSVVPVGA